MSYESQPIAGAATFFTVGALGLANHIDATTAAIIAGVVTTALMQFMTYLREGRKHQWEMQEREFDRTERKRIAAELKTNQADIAKHLAEVHAKTNEETRDQTLGAVAALDKKIDQNTVLIEQNTTVNEAALVAGEKAYTEANGITQKIQTLGLALRAPSRRTDVLSHEGGESLDSSAEHIVAVVEDTNKVVHKLRNKDPQ